MLESLRTKCGLNNDKSRAAERAASTDELEKREPVWKKGSESRFLFCASETEGTTWERRSCLLFRVTKAADDEMPEATLSQALEKDFCNWEIWNFYSKNNFKIQTCLFIIARFSASESLRVYINILKIPPPFASRTDIPLVGFATRAWARESATHCLILSQFINGSEGRREGSMNKQVCILKLFLE